MNTLSRRKALAAGVAAVGSLVAGCLSDEPTDWNEDETLPVSSVTQYHGPDCDCCDAYANYLQDHLDEDLEVTITDELTSIKEDHGIPPDLRSCHTVVIDEYIIEGHLPVAVIATLLDETPDIKGLALPGMPAGAPGMAGEKDEAWSVYELRTTAEPVVHTEL